MEATLAGKTDLDAMGIDELRAHITEAQEILDAKIGAKRAELLAELEALGGVPKSKPKPAAPRADDKRIEVKPMYRGPNGESYSGRGAIPNWAKNLGVTDREGLEQFRIKEEGAA